MDKLILISMMIFFLSNSVHAENPAVGGCGCNDFSALVKTDKQIEEQAKKEIQQMDYEAEHLKEETNSRLQGENVFPKKHWWQFWR